MERICVSARGVDTEGRRGNKGGAVGISCSATVDSVWIVGMIFPSGGV